MSRRSLLAPITERVPLPDDRPQAPILLPQYLTPSEVKRLLRTQSTREIKDGHPIYSLNITTRLDMQEIIRKVDALFDEHHLSRDLAGRPFEDRTDATTIRYPVGTGIESHRDDRTTVAAMSRSAKAVENWRVLMLLQSAEAGGDLYVNETLVSLKVAGDAVLICASHWPHRVTTVEAGERVLCSAGRVLTWM